MPTTVSPRASRASAVWKPMNPAAPVTSTVMREAHSPCSTDAASTPSAAEVTKILEAEPDQNADPLGDVAVGLEGLVDAQQDREALVAVERADPADPRFLAVEVVGIGAVGRPVLVHRQDRAGRDLLGARRADIEDRLGEMQVADADRAARADIERGGDLVAIGLQ